MWVVWASHRFSHQWLQPTKFVTEYDTLKTSDRTWEDLPEEQSFVKTGDPVRERLGAEDG